MSAAQPPSGGDLERGVAITVDGRAVQARPGQTVAGALLAAGEVGLRQTRGKRAPRGIFCGMGICYDCLVTVDDLPNVRACMTYVREGLRITTQGDAFWDEAR